MGWRPGTPGAAANQFGRRMQSGAPQGLGQQPRSGVRQSSRASGSGPQGPGYFGSLYRSGAQRGSAGTRAGVYGGWGSGRQTSMYGRGQGAAGQFGPGVGNRGNLQGRRASRGRRWPWLYPAGAGIGPVATGSPYISKIQGCLALALGPWVPQTGTLDAVTRAAVSAFQTLQQMPTTGVLDRATSSAIQGACDGQSGNAPTSPGSVPDAGSPSGPEPDAGLDGGAPAGADAPADAGAAGADQPPDSGPASGSGETEAYAELERGNEAEQEIIVAGQAQITAREMARKPLLDPSGLIATLPDKPGIYIIYVGDSPWYVGKAWNVQQRFGTRLKALRDLGLATNVLKGRSVKLVLLAPGQGQGTFASRERGKGRESERSVNVTEGSLRVLEQHYTKKLGTLRKGNVDPDPIVLRRGASVKIVVNGMEQSIEQSAPPVR